LAASFGEAGVRLLQYRQQAGVREELLEKSRPLAEELLPRQVHFIVNDRADVAALAGAGGVHVGPRRSWRRRGTRHRRAEAVVGVSTHNLEQFAAAAQTSADYIALGPIFATDTKANPDPVVGLEMIRAARRLTNKPIVAIGGITLERVAEVIAAGADSVAVISDILRAPDPQSAHALSSNCWKAQTMLHRVRQNGMADTAIPVREEAIRSEAGFVRAIGLFDGTMIVVGSMIGSGIFIVAADITRQTGSAGGLLLTWILTGVLTLSAALSYGELAAMFPRAGGQYIYLREAYSPLWAFFTAGRFSW